MRVREEQLQHLPDDAEAAHGLGGAAVDLADGPEQARLAVHAEVVQQVLDDSVQQRPADTTVWSQPALPNSGEVRAAQVCIPLAAVQVDAGGPRRDGQRRASLPGPPAVRQQLPDVVRHGLPRRPGQRPPQDGRQHAVGVLVVRQAQLVEDDCKGTCPLTLPTFLRVKSRAGHRVKAYS